MKFRAHDTFFIRKGWLAKGIKHIQKNPTVFLGRGGVNPMDTLGIGANMVKSLRYWLQAVGITEEKNRREQVFTPLGEIIRKHDPYFEELGTLWLLHYRLASNRDNATVWYYFFNEFRPSMFSHDDFIAQIGGWLRMAADCEDVPPARSLDDDFSCVISTYLSRVKVRQEKPDPESNMDCPFGELGLLDIADRKTKTYKKTVPGKGMLPSLILLAVLIDQAQGAKEIKLSMIQSNPCNAGKIFNLDMVALIGHLHQLEQMKLIKVDRTAGMDVIRFTKSLTFLESVECYYKEISE